MVIEKKKFEALELQYQSLESQLKIKLGLIENLSENIKNITKKDNDLVGEYRKEKLFLQKRVSTLESSNNKFKQRIKNIEHSCKSLRVEESKTTQENYDATLAFEKSMKKQKELIQTWKDKNQELKTQMYDLRTSKKSLNEKYEEKCHDLKQNKLKCIELEKIIRKLQN
eukprot:UN26263